MTEPKPRRFGAIAAGVLLAAIAVCRFLWLDRLPGINGDEAWYGVQILNLLDGREWSGRTPTGLPINPLLFFSQLGLHSALAPSFWLLRLPIAIWACAGLVLSFLLHTWVFGDRREALAAVLVTASLPLHLGYSRLCWDSSFAFVSAPLVVYALLRWLADGDRAAGVCFLLGCALTVWIHLTHAILVAACLLTIAWHHRRRLAASLRRRPMTTTGVAVAAAISVVWLAKQSPRGEELMRSAASTLARLPLHLESLGDILLGPRVYEYLAGTPRPPWALATYLMVLAAAVTGIFLLFRRGNQTDRSLTSVTLFMVLLVLVAGRALNLDQRGYERYVIYLAPFPGLVLVRSLRTGGAASAARRLARDAVPLIVSALFLAQFWTACLQPMRDHVHATRLHRTFRTGTREPKAEAAALIRQAAPRVVVVFVEDWWLQHPLEYLLHGSGRVQIGLPAEVTEPLIVVGFAESGYIADARATARRAGCRVQESAVSGTPQHAVLTLLVLTPLDASDVSDAD